MGLKTMEFSSIHDRGKKLISSPNRPGGFGAHPDSHLIGTEGFPNAMSTTNSIWIGPGSKPGIRDDNLATNILSMAGYFGYCYHCT